MKQSLVIALSAGLIVTGCINSIASKYQDNQCVRDCDGPRPVLFEQPVLQTLQMFIGESSVFVVLLLRIIAGGGSPRPRSVEKPPLPGNRVLLLALPAVCDICATTLMNVALTMIPVSVYQMTRGALIIFVAMFSIVFLGHRISRLEWCSLFVVVLGVTIVGCNGGSGSDGGSGGGSDGNDSLLSSVATARLSSSLFAGVFLILIAQLFMASQFVIEEHIMSRWTMMPVKLVGFEGVFGGSITLAVMLLGHLTFASGNPHSPFNVVQAFADMFASPRVLYSSVAIMFSIACFNFFGISITNSVNATARSTIDTCRTLMVWCVSLAIGWESFKFGQLFGFVLLILGTLVFNGAIKFRRESLPRFLAEDYPQDYERLIDVVDEEVDRF